MSRGLIVYFDGPDGAGKSTQLDLAAEALRAQGYTVYVTRVLGGSPIGELLRAAALSDQERPVETDLHIALACHYASRDDIMRRRQQGEIVLIDRSPLSILAYQVQGDELDETIGQEAVEELFVLIKPDLTLAYTANHSQLLHRRDNRDQPGDHFENKSDDYHVRVAQGFRAGAERFEATVINANQSIDAVHQETLELIQAKL